MQAGGSRRIASAVQWWVRYMGGIEDIDDAHGGAASGAQQPGGRRRLESGFAVVQFKRCFDAEKLSSDVEVSFTLCIGKKTVMADAVEATRHDVDEEAADKLVSLEWHGFVAVMLFGAVVLPLKGDVVFIEVDES